MENYDDLYYKSLNQKSFVLTTAARRPRVNIKTIIDPINKLCEQ